VREVHRAHGARLAPVFDQHDALTAEDGQRLRTGALLLRKAVAGAREPVSELPSASRWNSEARLEMKARAVASPSVFA